MSGHYRILVADDREENRGLLREWLTAQDYHVRCARDGREALELAQQEPPDLILIDKVMPEVDGLSVARTLKQDIRFSSVPIIVLTGRDDTRRQAIFDEAGADDLIMKPLTFEEVEVRVRTMLKKREVFRALERANVELREANERMQRLVQRDEKTELFNYRHFMDRLSEQFKMVRRYGSNLTVVMFDLDHFKSVNDRHGHVAGDQVLRQFGQIMSRTARETDLVARYGGEEFSVLLPNTSAAQGQRLAERVRKSTEGHLFDVPNGGGPAHVTVSAGVATFPINDRIAEPPDLVQAADDALYRAKGMGRNRSHVDEKSLVAFL
jgi:two-component system chemotaxis family response regulator WspR